MLWLGNWSYFYLDPHIEVDSDEELSNDGETLTPVEPFHYEEPPKRYKQKRKKVQTRKRTNQRTKLSPFNNVKTQMSPEPMMTYQRTRTRNLEQANVEKSGSYDYHTPVHYESEDTSNDDYNDVAENKVNRRLIYDAEDLEPIAPVLKYRAVMDSPIPADESVEQTSGMIAINVSSTSAGAQERVICLDCRFIEGLNSSL